MRRAAPGQPGRRALAAAVRAAAAPRAADTEAGAPLRPHGPPRRLLPGVAPGGAPTAAGPGPAGTAVATTGAPGRPKDHVPRPAEPRSEAGNGVRSDA